MYRTAVNRIPITIAINPDIYTDINTYDIYK